MFEADKQRHCPSCGSPKFSEAAKDPDAPEGFVILRDRVCEECGTRYAPATPGWAPFGLLVAGGALALGGFGYLVFGGREAATAQPLVGATIVGFGGLALAGFGIKLLVAPQPSKAKT